MTREEKYSDIDATITMESAITHLGLQQQFPIVATSKDYTCPFCQKKKKFNINFQKGVYKCWSCGKTGQAIRFWAYFRGFGDDISAAGKDYIKFLYGERKAGKPTKVILPKAQIVNEFEISTITERHAAYEAFLEMLTLTDIHKKNLLKRGMTEESIKKGEYRTAPMAATSAICHTLMSKGIVLEGIPGFYKNSTGWKFVDFGSGFLIPTRDLSGRIQALQIRTDTVNENSPRYLTISSAKRECGTKGHTYPHINRGNENFKEIILTEGPLKGDIISQYTGYPCIAILGVNATAMLPELLRELKKKGTRYINIALDMDLHSNANVQAALVKIKHLITSAGFRYCELEWDPRFKGLDDYLYAKTSKKTAGF